MNCRGLRLGALLWAISNPLVVPALACVQCCLDGTAHETAPVEAAAKPPACHRTAEAPPAPDETLNSTCSGPAALLLAALDAHAVITPRATVTPVHSIDGAPVMLAANPIALLAIPDTPPPRA